MIDSNKVSMIFDRAGRFLARSSLFVSVTLVLVVMSITVAEVVGRYFLNSPIHGKSDVIKLLLGASLFLALPVVSIQRDHISVDLLDEFFSGVVERVRDVVIDLTVCSTLWIMSFWIFLRAGKFLSRGEVTELLFIPRYPLAYFAALMFFIAGLGVFLTLVLRQLRRPNTTKTK